MHFSETSKIFDFIIWKTSLELESFESARRCSCFDTPEIHNFKNDFLKSDRKKSWKT